MIIRIPTRPAGTPHPARLKTQKIDQSLFDLEADIGETTNVADEHPDVVARLLDLRRSRAGRIGRHGDETHGKRRPGAGTGG